MPTIKCTDSRCERSYHLSPEGMKHAHALLDKKEQKGSSQGGLSSVKSDFSTEPSRPQSAKDIFDDYLETNAKDNDHGVKRDGPYDIVEELNDHYCAGDERFTVEREFEPLVGSMYSRDFLMKDNEEDQFYRVVGEEGWGWGDGIEYMHIQHVEPRKVYVPVFESHDDKRVDELESPHLQKMITDYLEKSLIYHKRGDEIEVELSENDFDYSVDDIIRDINRNGFPDHIEMHHVLPDDEEEYESIISPFGTHTNGELQNARSAHGAYIFEDTKTQESFGLQYNYHSEEGQTYNVSYDENAPFSINGIIALDRKEDKEDIQYK